MTLLLIATGDLIAQRAASVATGRELLELADPPPERVVVEDVLAEPSWDTSVSTQLALARRVRKALAEDEFTGVVVTHGVDTLEETAFLADLLAGPARGGIVFTGALRSLGDAAPDGPANLTASLTAAADPALRGAGAVVCLGDELHASRWAALRNGGFSSTPHPLLGRMVDGKVRLTSAPPPRPPHPDGEPETDIALLKTYPDMPPSLLTTVTDLGALGVVLEGTGGGNVPVELFGTITELTSMDIPVVVASRAHTTEIGLVERMGAISAAGLSAQKARMALMVALSKGGGYKAAVRYFGSL
ncbi:asparaginase domain-containing protein [Actinophytocola oryzae]|uniref:L-asparaginase n=1 Tax=Actinophytocola oryzae TaxID=502181 RepID=A0A4R7VM99_9PSEU|nr:asparaginase domain-containing protein [Actinophytocola oryzae]TDV50733.1 L-asparaginase [Actinophytocola oryzae]